MGDFFMMVKKLFSALCLSSLLAMSACSSSDGTSDATTTDEDVGVFETTYRVTYQFEGEAETEMLIAFSERTVDDQTETLFVEDQGGSGTAVETENGFDLDYNPGQTNRSMQIALVNGEPTGTVEKTNGDQALVTGESEPLTTDPLDPCTTNEDEKLWDIGLVDDPSARSDAYFFYDGAADVEGTGGNSIGTAICDWALDGNAFTMSCPLEDGGTVTIFATMLSNRYMLGTSFYTSAQGIEINQGAWDGALVGGH